MDSYAMIRFSLYFQHSTMKSFAVTLCVFAVASAASVDQPSQILRQTYEINSEGFQYGYENDNGINSQAEGVLKKDAKGEAYLGIIGSNSYKSPEGEIYSLTYTADENGYVPVGAHLPTPPAPEPIPDYIQRSLDYIKAHPYVEKKL